MEAGEQARGECGDPAGSLSTWVLLTVRPELINYKAPLNLRLTLTCLTSECDESSHFEPAFTLRTNVLSICLLLEEQNQDGITNSPWPCQETFASSIAGIHPLKVSL